MNQIRISNRGAKRIRQGHLWVYRNDVRDATGVEGGAIARVSDEAGNFVGQAFYSNRSEIALRFLTTGDETIDREWWRTRLRACAARRATIARETNAYRLVYSEGDLLPSLIVDVYDNVLVLQTLSQGADRLKQELMELLVEEFQPRAIIERNDARVRELEGLELRTGVLCSRGRLNSGLQNRGSVTQPRAVGPVSQPTPPAASRSLTAEVAEASAEDTENILSLRSSAEASVSSAVENQLETEINQHGVRFLVSPLAGQKTGAFLDQRENYLAARRVAHGRALDCFTFAGGFALHIAPACESVLGIDISADATNAARRNAQLNDARNVEFREANVFDALREMDAGGERFDTIILDPPAFAKNRASIPAAARGYKEINLRALKLLNQGGALITCSCSYHLSEEMFLEIIADAALDAHRRVQIIEKRGQSSDHPVLLGVPETRYLKCVIAGVIEQP